MNTKCTRWLGLLAGLAACAGTQGAVVFTDTFDHEGSIAGFEAAGWTNIVAGQGIGTEEYMGGSGQTVPESCMWGSACSLEYYAPNIVSCGDIISIDANCMRFEGYNYLREIVLWDGVNEASRVSVALDTSRAVALGNYQTWWFPPVKNPIATVTYHATEADAGKRIIFRYGHFSGWGDTADVTFSITPVTAPEFTVQPKSLERNEGEAASFSIELLGCGLHYQWQKDGQALPGANLATLDYAAVTAGQSGEYRCVVWNTYGTNVSDAALLAVVPKVGGGASMSFGVNFGDEEPWNPAVTMPAYGVHPSRWQETVPGDETGPINGMQSFPFGAGQIDLMWSANNTYSVPGDPDTLPTGEAQVNYGYLDDGGSGYSVLVYGLVNGLGYSRYVVRTIAASDNATNFAPVTLSDNVNFTNYTLTYPAVGPANPSGGKAAFSTVSPVLSADSITLASIREGTTLTRGCLAGFVVTDKPAIATQPEAPEGNLFNGEALTLTAEVFGVPPLALQWYKDGQAISGATTPTLSRPTATVADSGVYTLAITNEFGAVTTTPADVKVVAFIQPTVIEQPVARSAYLGRAVTFAALGYGGQLSYQWNKNAAPIAGQTNTTLTLTGLTTEDEADYTVTVSNPAGNITSDPARLTVMPVPTEGYLGTVLGDNPAAFWRLGETSGTNAVDSWGQNHAVYSGSYTLGTHGLIVDDANTAVQFAATSKAMAPFNPSLNNPAGPFSIEFWTVPDNTATECAISTQKRDSGRAGLTIFHNNGGSGFSALMGNNAGATAYVHGGTAIQPGMKYHVVLTYDGSTGKIYLNGKLDGSTALAFGAGGFEPNPDSPFQIGARNAGDAWGYNGVIDDVAVYDYALSDTQVFEHAWAGSPLRVTMAPASGIVVNAKPDAAPVHGQNNGAAWAESNSDGARTRTGVMQFAASEEDQIAVSGYPALNSTTGTICFWVRSGPNTGGGSEASMIMDRRDTGGSGSGTIISIKDDGTLFFQANPTGANPFSSFGTINDDKWHHVAVVYEQAISGAVSIFIDGVLDNTSYNAKEWWWPANMSVLLGKSRDSYWKRLNGSLDDVRFYSRILNAAEIGQVMASGAVVDAAALALRLDFDTAPVDGYRLSTSLSPCIIEASTQVNTGYAPLGSSPCLHIPSGDTQFFRAVMAE
ncbi:MAG TPA: hypothetical protein P5555_14715 [Candidatus Paceibacterota bacterium]|nr:hypothetical protein [Verrucomicrobiota bacterium]HRZ46433.1 hypothetical protein [Candidatus Paceibacterota bacterium]HRZ93741.1 hypothetical protein [Candidatus Paceibacterota bacterium]